MFAQLFERQQAQLAAIPPPPGYTQNFVDPPVAAQDAYILVGVGVAIAGLFVVMRIYTKGVLLKKLGLEDVAILLALAFSTADCILILEGRKYGTGRHLWDIPITTLVPKWGQIVTAAVVVYCPAIMFSKIAVLLCYLRISPLRLFRISVYVTMGVVFAYNIALMLSLIFACHPIAKNWDSTITTGYCINRPAVYLANGVLNIVTDFAILLLPLPMIKGLQMPLRQKLLLVAMFSVGSLACIVSIIRLKTLLPTLNAVDQSWAIANPGNWIIIEINLAVACGCLSCIRPFLRHHIPILVGESRNSRAEKYNKAYRSDYFSRGSRNSRKAPQLHSTESNVELSKPVDGTWNVPGYSQEIRSDGHAGKRDLGEDLELGDVIPPNPAKAAGDPIRQSGHIHSRSDDPLQGGIVKTMEVNVRR